MRNRLTLLVLTVLVLTLAPAGAALAKKGPSGSTEGKDGVVKCQHATGAHNGGVSASTNAAPAGKVAVYVGPSGVEVCSDDNDSVDGRAIVSSEGYAAIDGDSSNAAGQPQGWARLDSGGPTCSKPADPSTAEDNDATLDKGKSCAP